MSMTHIAGLDVEIKGRYLRQRCAWCGYSLIDCDYQHIATATLTAESITFEKPATWPGGRLVRVEHRAGLTAYSLLDDTTLPDDCCTEVLG